MIYVVAQFVLLLFLAWPMANLSFSALGAALILLAGIVALSALLANRPGNFNVRPTPKAGGELITFGIYYYIRHPMYCSLFFAGLGILFCQFSLWKLLAWFLLVLTLTLKARFEEQALLVKFPHYQEYQSTSKAFIPFLW
ncbi:methyltransferase [Psychromonas sp. MME2]|uniref:methyltransferase family protein n=1 Tax=unclassified Psychromonas TaxID=2614957 RepID=UPI00339BA768